MSNSLCKKKNVIALKRNVSIFLISLFLLLVMSTGKFQVTILYGMATDGNQRILYVPSDFTSIQAAVDNASSGDTIIVAPGTYNEALIISKSLTVIGEDRDTTIIDGSGVGDTFSIKSDYVNIQELTVVNNGTSSRNNGVVIDHCKGISVNNTEIINTYYAISLAFCSSSIFTNNVVFNNTFGIQLINTNNNVFSNNTILSNFEGIALDYINNFNVFFGNTLMNNSEGAAIRQSSYKNSFYHNNFLDPVTVETGQPNFWSRNGEGNYWSSYDGNDSYSGPSSLVTPQNEPGSDGIGDEAYSIPFAENNYDDYPLMGAFSEFNVVEKNDTYLVDIISKSTILDFRFETGRETGDKMIAFNASGESRTTGFCRIMIPTQLMDYPFIVVTSQGQTNQSLLDTSNETNAYLYFTYPDGNQTITITSSSALRLYDSLLDKYNGLQADLEALNMTYRELSESYNSTLQALLNNLGLMLQNFTQLQDSYLDLNSSLQQNLSQQTDSAQNMRNFAYVFAVMTGAFLITTVYLSARIHSSKRPKVPVAE
jgi:parallel beta-helix repeat protein